MKIIPYQAEHVLSLQLQAGQRDLWPYVTPEYARFLEGEYSFTAMVGDKVIAVGGVALLWENRGLAWTLIDRDAGAHFTELHKAAKRVLDLVPYRRIEADVACGFPQGHRWVRMLGFTLEAERMRAFRADGGDSALYSLVREVE
jgi:hypothetical protein